VGGLGSWEWLPETDEQQWSDNLFRLFGLEPGAIIPTWGYMFERMHPCDRGAVAFPALHQGEVLAVLEFYHREEASAAARLTNTMAAIGYELGEFMARRRGQFETPRLTPRELQVLKLAADGYLVPAIAERLGVGMTTIGTHMERIYAKLLAHDRGGAVAEGMRLGLIE